MARSIVLLFLLIAGGLAGQEAKQYYMMRIQPARGVAFLEHMTDAEQATMREHAEYLKKVFDQGKVIVAGPSINGEKTFGLVILEVASEAEARTIMENDPSVKSGIQKAELLPFRLYLLKGSPPTK